MEETNLEKLKNKFQYKLFLRSMELAYLDYKYYLSEVITLFDRTHSPENLMKFTGKDLKKSFKDPKLAAEVRDDEIFLFIPPAIDTSLRRSIENATFRIIAFRDKVLRLVNDWAGFHLEERRVNLDLLLGSARMFDYPYLKKVLEIFNGPNFKQIDRLRNDYIHFDSPSIDVEHKNGKNAKVVVRSSGSFNLFKQKPEMTSVNLITIFQKVNAEMDEIIVLLDKGIDDLRSGRKRLFS